MPNTKQIAFTEQQGVNYPQLMRLIKDFDFCTLEIEDDKNYLIRQYQLICEDQGQSYTSPRFDTLIALERYTAINAADILHQYVFGADDAVANLAG